ncbi:MAG: type IV pili twitching motility protein PilT, partial [Defluviitaleaceae bacterium]|nr:type IV pili twitching motility protein PilT [Defluviitaleaceae bacterium]
MDASKFVEDLIISAREHKASDIHLTVGSPPVFRIHGQLTSIEKFSDAIISNRTILSMLDARQEEQLNSGEDLDFVSEIESGDRQRFNVYRQMGILACAIRMIETTVRSFAELR